MTSIETFFCPECDNILRLRKGVNGNKELACRYCGTVVIEEEKQDIESIPNECNEDIDGDDKYDFENKEASRLVIKRLLETCKKEGLVKPFSKQRVLILTHVKAHDIKQVLLPLGYRKENIVIIERDVDVYKKIRDDTFFAGCEIKHVDLEDFKDRSTVFDLLYLDFKSNISLGIVQTITNLLAKNTREGTAVYINLQMARETREMINGYVEMNAGLIGDLEKKIKEKREETLSEDIITGFTDFVTGKMDLHGKVRDVDITKVLEYFDIRDLLSLARLMWNRPGNEKVTLKLDLDGSSLELNKDDDEDVIREKIIQWKDGTIKESRIKRELESEKKWHVHRQKTVEFCVKNALNIFLIHTEMFSKLMRGNNFNVTVPFEIFKMEDIPDRKKRMMPLMRYMAQTLVPIRFTQFVYQTSSKNRTPFLNTFFVLRKMNTIIEDRGYNANMIRCIGDAFFIFWMHNKGYIRDGVTKLSLTNFLAFEDLARGNMTKESANDYERNHQNEIRNIFNTMRNIYKDFVSSHLCEISDDGNIKFRLLNSNLKGVSYHGVMEKLAMAAASKKLRSKKIDASTALLAFHLLITLLDEMEKEIDRSYKIRECTSIDIPEGANIKDVVDGIMPMIIDPVEPIFAIANAFKERMMDVLKKTRDHVENTRRMLNQSPEISAIYKKNRIDFKTLVEEYNLINIAIDLLFHERKMKESKPVEQPEPVKVVPSDDQIACVIRKFVADNYGVVSSKLAAMINDHVKSEFGCDPGVTDPMVRAHKYWHRCRSSDPA